MIERDAADLSGRLVLSAGTPFAEWVDPTTLRTSVVDVGALQRFAERLRSERHELEGVALRQNLQSAGTAARMLGDVRAAETELTSALDLCGDDPRARALAVLRLAEVYRVAGDRVRAARMLDDCVAAADDLDDAAAAVIHQHAGKFAFDEARWSDALRHFEIAHSRRERTGHPDLESSRLAVVVTRIRLAGTP